MKEHPKQTTPSGSLRMNLFEANGIPQPHADKMSDIYDEMARCGMATNQTAWSMIVCYFENEIKLKNEVLK